MAGKKKSDWAKREEEILKFWQEEKVFEKTLARPAPRGEFVFYEGPPTANGRPGLHHLGARAFKDLIPRYQTMRGFHVRRKAGWDTHGLPVELEVEKKLGFKSKKDIEKYGIAAFNQKCRENVWRHLKEWRRFTDRIGFWLDQENSYITYQPNYIESLWHILKTVHQRGLLYRDYKVVPWCPRCGTALSFHELAQGYQKVKDQAVYVKFKVKSPKKHNLPENTFLLAWTTTPWTLPGNVALAVGAEINYDLWQKGDEHLIASRKFVSLASPEPVSPRSSVLLASGPARPLTQQVPASQLTGIDYEPLFDFPQLQNDKSHRVYAADFVNLAEGTGIVHTAVMYGPDDFELGTKVGLPKRHLVDEDGRFVSGTPWAGEFVKNVNSKIVVALDKRGLLFGKETVEHDYPFCWRCKTPLLYYARDSWYIKTSARRDELVEENQKIHWEPDHIRDGRFGEWLRENKDWAISRERYWGTPLPIWQGEKTGKTVVIGSLAELQSYVKKSGNRYWLLRHGEAESNVRGFISANDKAPSALTEKGKAQSETAARGLKNLGGIDYLFVSPLLRARRTAEIVARVLALPAERVIVDERLKEIQTGEFSGRPMSKYREAFPTHEDRFRRSPRGGETLLDVRRRAGQFIFGLENRFAGQKILIITHEDVAWMLQALARGADERQSIAWRAGRDDAIATGEVQELPFIPLPVDSDYQLDLHRPFIDDLVLVDEAGERLRRVPEVVDVWFDSGAVPFAQDHYPFENREWVEGVGYPADYIAEAIDQTRGWFYTLHAVGTLLGRGRAYKNVICLGHLLDWEGKKMSKSLGNVVDPWEMIERFGADGLRFWMFVVNQPGEAKNFDEKSVTEVANRFFNPLLNSLRFYRTYRGKAPPRPRPAEGGAAGDDVLDRWAVSRLHELSRAVASRLDDLKITEAARTLRDFVVDLSQWYIRRSRDRFRGKDKLRHQSTTAATRYLLRELAKVAAPFVPFLAEAVYQEVKDANDPISVHLCDWPAEGVVDEEILSKMAETRQLVALGLEARERTGIRVRQPLKSVKFKTRLSVHPAGGTDGQTQNVKLPDAYIELIKEELNVKGVVFDSNLLAGVELDTVITLELQEEGEFRDLVRGLQQWRKIAGLNPGQLAAVPVPAGKEALARKFVGQLKEAVGASELIFPD